MKSTICRAFGLLYLLCVLVIEFRYLFLTSHAMADHIGKGQLRAEAEDQGTRRQRFPILIPKEGVLRKVAAADAKNGLLRYEVFIPLDVHESTATIAYKAIETDTEVIVYLSSYAHLPGTAPSGNFPVRSQVRKIKLYGKYEESKIHLNWLKGDKIKFLDDNDVSVKLLEQVRPVNLARKKGDESTSRITFETELSAPGNRLGSVAHKVVPNNGGVDIFMSVVEIETRRFEVIPRTDKRAIRFTIDVPSAVVEKLSQVNVRLLK